MQVRARADLLTQLTQKVLKHAQNCFNPFQTVLVNPTAIKTALTHTHTHTVMISVSLTHCRTTTRVTLQDHTNHT